LSPADQDAIHAFTEPVKEALREMREKEEARFKVGLWHTDKVRIPTILFADDEDDQRHLQPCWNIVCCNI
jgi:hypothetical protein